jgi:hypothetical protein
MLSLGKLEKLLTSKDIVITSIFTISNMCVFIECLCLKNGNNFLMYIPSKYDIAVGERQNYELKDVEIDENGNIPDDYAGKPDQDDLDNAYNEVDVNTSLENKKENIEDTLEEKYDRPIELKDVSKDDKKDMKDTYRQLKRLRNCTKHLNYKLGIMYKNYLSCIRRDDSISCYLIKRFEGHDLHKLIVVVDLETLYSNMETFNDDIKTVEDGVIKILDKNESSHHKTFQLLLEEEQNITNKESILETKMEYESLIKHLKKLLDDINSASTKIETDITKANEKYNKNDNIHSDMEKTHVLKKLHSDLEKVNEIKREILQNLLSVKLQREELFLSTDKILFDNNVMLNSVVKNLSKYYTMLKK